MEAYKLRFLKEYSELKERTNKLEVMLDKWVYGDLGFEPSCPYDLLESQFYTMKAYLNILNQRAEIEDIDLNRGIGLPKIEFPTYKISCEDNNEILVEDPAIMKELVMTILGDSGEVTIKKDK